ncbi:MAG: M20/M25/M40 family metallo-hydrolase, partial [Clostridium sp.]
IIRGESNHAGATPMELRKDPIVEGCKLVSEIPSLVREFGDDSLVATVGKFELSPNLTNVIPLEVKFSIDLRGINKENNDKLLNLIEKRLEEIKSRGFETSIELIAHAKETKSSDKILNIIEQEAINEEFKYKKMYSGSNHDTSIMAEVTDVAMIFVPSVDGKSHCAEEFTKEEDIKNGCQLLLNTIYKLINN